MVLHRIQSRAAAMRGFTAADEYAHLADHAMRMRRPLQLAEEEILLTLYHAVVMMVIMEVGSFVFYASHVIEMQTRLARAVQGTLQMLSRVHAMQDTMVLDSLVCSALLVISQNQVDYVVTIYVCNSLAVFVDDWGKKECA
jgi:hypothetical protein